VFHKIRGIFGQPLSLLRPKKRLWFKQLPLEQESWIWS